MLFIPPLPGKKKKRLFIEFEAKMGYLDGKIRQVVKDLDWNSKEKSGENVREYGNREANVC